MTAAAPAENSFRDYKILSVISVGHFMSHFYALTLPPIFLYLKEDFNVSFVQLGLMLTLAGASTLAVQVPVGFLVDRYGARIMLAIGLVILSSCYALAGLATDYYSMIALLMIAGVGNSVFHPADYAILNSSITPTRMGRAFSIHTFAGHLGSAAAPATMLILTYLFGWRFALVSVGAFGLAVALVLATQWNVMKEETGHSGKKEEGAKSSTVDGLKLLVSPIVIVFFLFFGILAMASAGLSAFMVAALMKLHNTPLETATMALSAYLFFSSAGILLGGELSDRFGRHALMAGIVFAATAVFCFIIGTFAMPFALLAVLMMIMGAGQGIIRPARDMMLREVAPKGSVGKIFGFVSAGITAGSTLAPILFGLMIDLGRPEWVFYLAGLLMILALFTVMIPRKPQPV